MGTLVMLSFSDGNNFVVVDGVCLPEVVDILDEDCVDCEFAKLLLADVTALSYCKYQNKNICYRNACSIQNCSHYGTYIYTNFCLYSSVYLKKRRKKENDNKSSSVYFFVLVYISSRIVNIANTFIQDYIALFTRNESRSHSQSIFSVVQKKRMIISTFSRCVNLVCYIHILGC